MFNNAAHVLVFDSGVGGLSVVAELRKLMPKLFITYVADDAFRPYGDKTEAQLKARLPELLKTLVITSNPDAVVIACNTASTTALREIRAALDVPVIGVVPAIKPAAQMSKTKAIAVLGTPGTVRRKYVDRLVSDFGNGCHVILHGSTELVALAEDKMSGGGVDLARIKAEIEPMFLRNKGGEIDVVVLACTHFPLLVAELESVVPHKVAWIDSGAAIARRTQLLLERASPLKNTENPQHNTALLIGPKTSAARRKTFAAFGFDRVIALEPE